MTPCFFAQFTDTPCDFGPRGFPDPCHLIPKTRLKHAGITEQDLVWDKRNVVPGCRKHHGDFDSKRIRLFIEDYPLTLIAFASEHNFTFRGARDGWRHELQREAA